LSWVGVVWALKHPPQQVLRNEQRLGLKVINRAAEQLAGQFNAERIVLAISAALHGPELSGLRDALSRAHHRTTEVLTTLQLPQIPSREEFMTAAKLMFVKTTSMDEIVDRAHELLLIAIGRHLAAPAEQPA
jgi:stearoyl-CoA desaturase (delta-9 desaturase)